MFNFLFEYCTEGLNKKSVLGGHSRESSFIEDVNLLNIYQVV